MGPLRPVLVLNHPDTIKQILKTTEPKPTKDRGGYAFLFPWIGDGLLLSTGAKWFRNRRLLTPGFHFEILKPYMDIYNDSTSMMMKNIADEATTGKSVEIFSHIGLLTLDIILQCAFSHSDKIQSKGTSDPYINTVFSLSKLITKRAFTLHHYIDFIYKLSKDGKEFYRNCDFSHKKAQHVIQSRRANIDKDSDVIKSKRYVDFLDILLLAQDEDGCSLTDSEIMDEVETFMFEGHDTTSSGLSWALYNLARHPEFQEKAQREIDSIMNTKSVKTVEWNDLPKFEYLTMCIKESLRLHPPVHLISRQLTKPTLIENHLAPIDTTIDINIWNLHHNPSVWGDNVMTYDPNRFLPDNMVKMDPFAFLPFSAGPRNCIGQHFAMNEMKTTVALILYNFKLSLDDSHKVQMVSEVILKAKDGIKLFFHKRNKDSL